MMRALYRLRRSLALIIYPEMGVEARLQATIRASRAQRGAEISQRPAGPCRSGSHPGRSLQAPGRDVLRQLIVALDRAEDSAAAAVIGCAWLFGALVLGLWLTGVR